MEIEISNIQKGSKCKTFGVLAYKMILEFYLFVSLKYYLIFVTNV